MAGILYVIFNKWVNNPETKEMPYKIGITSGTVEDRYYGLGLKMPGEFETLYAYLLENYRQAEKFFHNIFELYQLKGEWFNLTQDQLNFFKSGCEQMKGIDVKNKIEIEKEPIQKSKENNKKCGKTDSTLSENNIFAEDKNELNEVSNFFRDKGFDISNSKLAFGKEVYIICYVKGNGTKGVWFVISKYPDRPTTHKYRYKFKYETKFIHEEIYKLEEKQKIIEKAYPGISEFKKGKESEKGKGLNKIEFSLNQGDLEINARGEEVLNIIEKTRGIIGF